MNSNEIKLLSKMKQLVKDGKRKFQIRKDRDYIEELLNIGITEKSAWEEHIINLNSNFYYFDLKPYYMKSDDILLFKKDINGVMVYIKLKIEREKNGEEEVVCLSFHQDNR